MMYMLRCTHPHLLNLWFCGAIAAFSISLNGLNAFMIKLNPDAGRQNNKTRLRTWWRWNAILLIHPPCLRLFVFRTPVIIRVFSDGFFNNSRPRIVAKEWTTFALFRGGMTRSMTVMTILFSSSWKYFFLAWGGNHPFRMGKLIENAAAQKKLFIVLRRNKRDASYSH